MRAPFPFTLRTSLRPGDLGTIVHLHGDLYSREYGFDASFEAYVAGPLSELALRGSSRERLWIAERDGKFLGCVAIVDASDDIAQLRFYLVVPEARGSGIGRRLLEEAVAFARDEGYVSIFLWTVGALEAAAHLYRAAGFVKVEEVPGAPWGVPVVEEKYVLHFAGEEIV
ncbi:MAG TPA: GNAT family N-acetyltransferase [Candidatus Polarisedimenticolaceae bacterium]